MPSASVSAASVAANGGTLTQDVDVAGEDFLTAVAQIGPTAAAAGDIDLKVVPYFADVPADHGNGPALMPAGMALPNSTADPGVAAALAAGVATVLVRVRVTGFDHVQLIATNKNATTALPVRLDHFFD